MSTCHHCGSDDSMTPFRRPERVFLLSRLFPSLRRRYCRTCTRHYLVRFAVPADPPPAAPAEPPILLGDAPPPRRRRFVSR